MTSSASAGSIAIVGMSCLFPEADSLQQYWDHIRNGDDLIRELPLTHWRPDDYYDPDPKRPDHTYAKTGAFLRPYAFDPLKFGISPQAIEATDTTQLLGMVAAVQALENAGYESALPTAAQEASAKALRSFDRHRTSCILGVTGTLELVIPLGARLGHPHWRRALQRAGIAEELAEQVMRDISESYVGWQEASFPGLLGNVVAGRIANRLDLGGTNSVVDAACASSLSAIRTAMMELETHRADMVITGGMDTFNDVFMYMCFSKTPALSPTGQARPFDAKGDGTILGEGIGAVILKRLADAERDGDRIYAVIKGMGSASDGRGKAIYAPDAGGQAKALRRAYQEAGVSPSTVGLIEAHGTGTKVGDGVELKALKTVFTEADPEYPIYCQIGSVKSQIGHTKAAAGAAGLIKAALALYHKVLPPTVKIEKPHPELEAGPFQVSLTARPWMRRQGLPRRAGVSAFGFGGSNFHCVLEEYGATKTADDWSHDTILVPFAATARQQLQEQLRELIAELQPIESQQQQWLALHRLAQNLLQAAQDPDLRSCRLALVVRNGESIVDRFQQAYELVANPDAQKRTPEGIYFSPNVTEVGQLGVVFSGQGSQYPGMLAGLATRFGVFQDMLQQANDVWAQVHAGATKQLSDYIYPPDVFSEEEKRQQRDNLRATQIAQPAIGAVSAGCWRLLQQLGLKAHVFAGHSFGELTALFAAGVFSAEGFLQASTLRGQLMHDLGPDAGTMLAVQTDRQSLQNLIETQRLDVVLANHNAPNQSVLAGCDDAISQAEKLCQSKGWSCVRLNVAAAFHSHLVEPAVGPFENGLQAIPLAAPQATVYGNTKGTPYDGNTDSLRLRLAKQLACPVDFADMIQRMYQDGVRFFLEVGPQRVLQRLVRQCLPDVNDVLVLAIDTGAADSWNGVLHSLAALYAAGYYRLSESLLGCLDPQAFVAKPKFSVPISGANYRAPVAKDETPPVAKSPVKKPEITAKMSRSSRHPTNDGNVETTNVRPLMTKQEPLASTQGSARALIEQQLRNLQQMQQKNAELHKQFLDMQATSQQMMQDLLVQFTSEPQIQKSETRAGAVNKVQGAPTAGPGPLNRDLEMDLSPRQHEASATLPGMEERGLETSQPIVEVRGTEDDPLNLGIQRSVAPSSVHESVTVERSGGSHSAGEEKGQDATEAAANDGLIVAIIAEKTGYPEDMIDASMSLEDDLGIDSIKRVEILSRIQESVPALAELETDVLQSIQTVGDLQLQLQKLAGVEQPTNRVESSSEMSPTTDLSAATAELVKTILAEKTGYPAEMIEQDQRLEDDLGIDSIKRVEILSELQSRQPELAAVFKDNDQAANIGTVGDLVAIASHVDAQTIESAKDQGSVDETVLATSAGSESIPGSQATVESPRRSFEETVKQVISDKTGYPVEMLEPHQLLEDDLGIDSIKRVEILSRLSELEPKLQQVPAEELSQLASLQDLFALSGTVQEEPQLESKSTASHPRQGARGLALILESKDKTTPEQAERHGATSRDDAEDATASEENASEDPVTRILGRAPHHIKLESWDLGFKEIDLEGAEQLRLRAGALIWVTDDGSNLARNIVLKLREKGFKPRLVSVAFVDRMRAPDELDGLILLAPLKQDNLRSSKFLLQSFKLTKLVAPALRRAEADFDRFFSVVTRNGGYFGVQGLDQELQAYGAALAALAKTVRHEWPDVVTHSLDLARDFKDGFEAVQRLLLSCFQKSFFEVGVFRDRILECELHPVRLQAGEALPLNSDDTVLVTGGARGVTFAAALALAARYGVGLQIWGRTQLLEEPQWLATVEGEKERKAAIRQENPSMSPKELGITYEMWERVRELKQNLATLKTVADRIDYRVVDVSQSKQIREVLAEQESARFAGLVHGAGILRDRLIEDLSEEHFSETLDTKASLLEHLDHDVFAELKLVAFFSSSTARFGRKGQLAYAVANELLNKYAHFLNQQRPSCRVVAFNWGPWDGGMVTPSLKKVFSDEGIAAIPLRSGASLFLNAIEQTHPTTELVVVAEEQNLLEEWQQEPDAAQELLMSLEHVPLLADHVIKNQIVFPVVLHLEAMVASAMNHYPSLRFQGVRNFQILRGIRFGRQESLRYRIELGQANVVHGGMVVGAQLQFCDPASLSSSKEETWVKSSVAELWLTEEPLEIAHGALNVCDEFVDRFSVSDAYREFLFHGKAFQALTVIDGLAANAAEARVLTAHQHDDWSGMQPIGKHWRLDPLALDGAFQLGVLWSSRAKGLRSLPMSFHSYVQYCDRFPKEDCRVRLQVTDQGPHHFEATIEWLDAHGRLLATMSGYRAVMDQSLDASFKQVDLGLSPNELH